MEVHRPLTFKVATEDWELEQVHRLNHLTFAEEIPQHAPHANRQLVDKFHDENTYIIALDGQVLAGMAAIRGKRPFSLDLKLPQLDSFLPAGRRVCEIRLLAVLKEYRHGWVFRGLTEKLAKFGLDHGFDMAIISGTTRQLKLYRHMGFLPFGPLVGSAEAQYQPMFLTLESFIQNAKAMLPSAPLTAREPVSFLPGPVGINPAVQKVLGQRAVSHRSESFLQHFRIVKQLLRQMTGANGVELLVGTGTLANDAVAAQLSLEQKPGLILVNGEFGERLVDHATRFGLQFETHTADWGKCFDWSELSKQLDAIPRLNWVWAVHCETSTGVLNDLGALKQLCQARKLRLCMDCISSIGSVPVDLSGVFFASGVSGKALAGFPGLSLVFYNHNLPPAPRKLPRYMDLGCYAAADGVPFTHSSNLVLALEHALSRWDVHRFDKLAEDAAWLRSQLRSLGIEVLAGEKVSSPAVFTLVLPGKMSSAKAASELQDAGYLLSYGSEYLLRRNWLQICLMGDYTRQDLEGLIVELGRLQESPTFRSAAVLTESRAGTMAA
jgi:aspartate aminotransferase-like enzyme